MFCNNEAEFPPSIIVITTKKLDDGSEIRENLQGKHFSL